MGNRRNGVSPFFPFPNGIRACLPILRGSRWRAGEHGFIWFRIKIRGKSDSPRSESRCIPGSDLFGPCIHFRIFCLHQSLVKIDFINSQNEKDTVAFKVPYPPQWMQAIENTLIKKKWAFIGSAFRVIFLSLALGVSSRANCHALILSNRSIPVRFSFRAHK